jgi:hypothetical protein
MVGIYKSGVVSRNSNDVETCVCGICLRGQCEKKHGPLLVTQLQLSLEVEARTGVREREKGSVVVVDDDDDEYDDEREVDEECAV